MASLKPWKDLIKIGGWTCFLVALLIVFAIVAYFIWPYSPLEKSISDIFTLLQKDKIGGLFSLDLVMIITVIVNVIPVLAFYVVLKQVNESYALIAVVLSLIALAVVITSRPLQEMLILSERYADTSNPELEARLLAAGEAFKVLFDGTAWFIQTILLITGGLINAILMLKSKVFNKGIATLGIITSASGFGFVIPEVGILFLFLNTILTIPFYILAGKKFLNAAHALH